MSQKRIVSSYEPLIRRLPRIFVSGGNHGIYEALTAQEERRAEVRVPIEETDALRKPVVEVRLAVVEGPIQRLPAAH